MSVDWVSQELDSEDYADFVVQASVATNLTDIIGKGVDFPLRFNTVGKVGAIAESEIEERIDDSIHLILSTRPGERVFNPEFGSKLPSLVFEQNDVVLHNLLRIYTVEALKRWEKRISVQRVDLLDDLSTAGDTIGINIVYFIRNTHIHGSYVYPFVKEGMTDSKLYTGVKTTTGTAVVK